MPTPSSASAEGIVKPVPLSTAQNPGANMAAHTKKLRAICMVEETWDAAVVGAGPAGGVSAALLAARGWRVLLVEKADWPRDKACGGCLNAGAVELLRAAGLEHVLHGAAPLMLLRLQSGIRGVSLPLPAGMAVERRLFDASLVARACLRGCVFRPQTSARLLPKTSDDFRTLQLTCALQAPGLQSLGLHAIDSQTHTIRARVVLACDGLQGASLAQEPWAGRIRRHPSRLGFSTTLPRNFPEGTLGMFLGPAGYVGIVRLTEGRAHVGAALWPHACNARHGPLPVINDILQTCGQAPLPSGTEFHATGPLTVHRAAVADRRVLAIGDACGYIEPFTGEGISWAIRGALEAVRLLPDHAADWHDGLIAQWQERFTVAVRQRQHWCRWLTRVLRHPRLAAACLAVAQHVPAAPALLARRICA